METLGNQNMPKLYYKYYCDLCDYGTCKKSSFDNHNISTKHAKRIKLCQLETLGNQIMPKLCSSEYFCEKCKKEFKNRSGLWKHKSKCICIKTNEIIVQNNNNIKPSNNDASPELINIITELVKGQYVLQESIIELCKNGTHNTTHTNSHNKAFNLNLFLNETCKDAMNINDFVESIKLQVSDLENVGEVGFVEGISNIIVKNLNALDITKRPIHCTDKKRETIYIKDENTWEKDESQGKMRRMIKKVVSKNQRLIPKFKEQNPEYNKSYSKVSDKYNKLIIESMGGSGDNDLEKEDKIVRNIVKNVVVDKEK